MWRKRIVFLSFLTGLITILCHAKAFAPDNRGAFSLILELPGPSAKDDSATTPEDTPSSLNVLLNDDDDRRGDDDEEEDGEIDASTVDLDPRTESRDKEITNGKGDFSVDDTGVLTYAPLKDFSGSSSIKYVVRDKRGERSNEATVTFFVTETNDPPVITGQDALSVNEDESITLSLDNLDVTDPDNTYPTGFTMIIAPGSDYTVSGMMITPQPNFSGTLTVPVQVNDGESSSNTFNLAITVIGVNDVPVITAQTPDPVTTAEEQPVDILFSNLVVTDPDDNYPQDFTLTISTGTNYLVNGNTITPATDFSGTLTVPVTVNDGESNSNTYSFLINVTGSNDIPEITGQSALSVDEDNSIRVQLSDLQVTDTDNTYPADFTLTLLTGSNYSVSGTTITPDANYSGTLSVSAYVNDGINNSNTFTLSITVSPINDAPVISGQNNLSASENQSITVALSDLSVTDPDNSYPDGFTLSISPGNNYSVSGNVITPSAGFSGTLSADVTVNDGISNSNVFPLQIAVAAVNDPPTITGQNSLTVAEDNPITLQLSDFLVSDPDNTYPNGFTLSVSSGSDYTISGNTIIPAADFTGSLSVSVIVNDGTSDSAPFNAVISVAPVNDAPVITGQNMLTTSEDQAITLQLADLIVTDPDNSYPAGFTLLLSPGDNYSVTDLTITPAADFKGTLNIPAQVNDGELNSNVFALQISVTDVNDPPVIIGQTPLSTEEDTSVEILLSQLTVFDPDNSFPTGFTLNVSAGENYSVSGNTITPAANFSGTLNISITVNDGVNNSEPFIFQIQVGDANDPPTITAQSQLSTNEEQSITILLSHLTVSDPDNVYPNDFSLSVAQGTDYTVSENTITPALNFYGTLTIPVRVNDGVNNSSTFDLKVEVNPVNDAPSFDAIDNVNISENAQSGVVPISNISKGPNEDAQQVTFVASSSNSALVPNPVITYNGTSDKAALAYSVVPNVSGTVTITVTAVDNGSGVAPNQNTYSSTFQINISEINSAPTLDVISNQTVNEDSPAVTIPLTGITSGAGESQTLTVTAVAAKPELFEIFEVTYTSPASGGSLQIKPKPNANGVTQITVTVTDNGSNIAPSVNFVARSFVLTILPINDPPVFVSKPVTVAAVNEPYEYIVEISDEESQSLPMSAQEKPSWASFSTVSGLKARLAGTPPSSATGTSNVNIIVKDGDITVEQKFSLVVNTRPTVTSFDVSTQEDVQINFQQSQFANTYSDVNQHPINSIQIVEMPVSGTLYLSDVEVQPLDTILAASISNLVYRSDKDFNGQDIFKWKASDGYHFSQSAANVNISIQPVNDPPVITMETDSLQYDINGEPASLTSLFDVYDPDNDSLYSAEIVFQGSNHQPQFDMLEFENTANVKGSFDFQTGKLSFRGDAPISEYRQAIKSIKYNHLNTVDPRLGYKILAFTVSDNKISSEPVNRIVALEFTFIELNIPTGFTPNGDNANDTWIITRPGGVEHFQRAVISVFNKRGTLVYRTLGFDTPWDGRFNGETLPAGTYYFTIDLKLRSKKIYKGVVTILR